MTRAAWVLWLALLGVVAWVGVLLAAGYVGHGMWLVLRAGWDAWPSV